MLLSIGMIVKNEEKYLRDCLNGLKPILEQMPSELIICDTGSTDSTIEIAKEFTDKVFEIGWRDDFAWARDQNLKRARGKWYMYIDADEILQDVTDLIDFFDSGEYKNYATASFEMKNFLDHTESNFSMFSAMRLYKIEKDTRWKGKIHEYIEPIKIPAKKLETLALHYGYVFEDMETRNAKAERNKKPMLEQFERDPKDLRNIVHLVQHYMGFSDFEEAKRYADIGLALYEKNTTVVFWHAINQQNVSNYIAMKKWEEAADAVQDYFTNASIVYANAYYMKYMECLALTELERYEEAGNAGVASWKYWEQKDKGELDTYILSCTTLIDTKKDDVLTAICTSYTLAGLFDLASEWTEKYEEGDERKNADIYNIFAGYAYVKDISKISVLYDYVAAKYGIDSKEYSNVIGIIENNMENPEQKSAVAESLVKGREDLGDGYIRLQHLRLLDLKGDPTAQNELDYFIRTDAVFSQHFGDILIAAIKYKADFISLVDKLRITNATEFMVSTLRLTIGFSDDLLEYMEETNFVKECNSIKALRLVSGLLSILTDIEPAMEKATNKKEAGEEKQLILFESYVRLRNKYLKMTYKEEIYCEEMVSRLPEQDGFAFYVARAFECKDASDKAGYIQNLRLALKILPNMKDIINSLVDKLKEEESAPTAQAQLVSETNRLKSIIYTMINTGNMAQAAQILESYEQVNPTDPEIGKIREMVEAS